MDNRADGCLITDCIFASKMECLMPDRVIELNRIIDGLIDIAHEEYFKHTDVKEQARLDGKIKAYWEVKNCVENILTI